MADQRQPYTMTDIPVNLKSSEDILYNNTKEPSVLTNEVSKSKDTVKHNPFLGFFYISVCSVIFTWSSVMVKKLSYINVSQLNMIRNAGIFVGSLPVAVYCANEVFGAKKYRRLLLARGLFGATALYLNLTAYRYLPIAEAAIILSTAPALTTLAAHFYLKEPFSFMQLLSLVLTVIGVLTSVRLPELLRNRDVTRFDIFYLGGVAAAVACVITVSFAFVAVRKLKDIHFSIPMMYFGFVGMIENAAINSVSSTFETPFCGWDFVMYALTASLGFVSNCVFTLSVQVQAAGIASVQKASMDIINAILFQIIFFRENPDIYNISGACLVIASVSVLGIRNWLLMLPEESNTRKRLKYFLY